MAAPNYEVETIEYSKLRDLTLIGEGGFGEVYRANHSDWGPVAFKKLTVQFIREKERAATELRSEVAIHSRLKHTNIVILMGVVFEPGYYGVVLEYATHGDLWNFIRRYYPVAWPWKLNMTHGIVLGINYLHTARERPLIHGDLKMKNVLIADGFKPKISDFGLSRWKRYSYEMTRRDCTGGTVTHIPPENWQDINTCPTEKYDVYSFGVLLWELLSENHPFNTADTNTIKDAVLAGQRPHMYFIPADVPEILKQVIVECWAQNPNDRPLFNVLKSRLGNYVEMHKDAISFARQQLQQRDGRGWTAGETVRVPAPNVPTGPVPVSADPRTRPLLPASVTGRSHVVEHPGVVLLPSDQHVRTNKGLGNIQPSNSDFLSHDISAAASTSHQTAYEQDLHPDEPFRSDHSVGSRMERMELSSGELPTITEQSSQSAENMDL